MNFAPRKGHTSSMESPNKRLKASPPENEDFISFGGDDDEDDAAQYGYDAPNAFASQPDQTLSHPPRAPRATQHQHHRPRNAWNDPRNAKDKPKTQHALPAHEPWILVKTKFGRRFVHNTETKESLWRIPRDVMVGVLEFERWEVQVREKEANARWAEEQLRGMQEGVKVGEVNKRVDVERTRRRRSESLQREDEEAMMAELAVQAERAEEVDAREALKRVEGVQPNVLQQGGGGYDSESSYEEVEVTDSEFEDDEHQAQPNPATNEDAAQDHQEDIPVEFGEDDIAYQLAAMGEDYGLDQGEYGEAGEGEAWDEEAEGLPLTTEEATTLFREMLDEHGISPFTPWEKLIADEDAETSSILLDDRYTVLPNMKSRKAVWEAWVKDTAARLKEERAKMEVLDPRIPYLAFLQTNATPKLYWPEFKRKYKKDSVMTDRKLGDRDREKLYREHIARLKLPVERRKADLVNLLRSFEVEGFMGIDELPQGVRGHLHFISLPVGVTDEVVDSYMLTLPSGNR